MAILFLFCFHINMISMRSISSLNNYNYQKSSNPTFTSSYKFCQPDVFVRSCDDWIELRNLLNAKMSEYNFIFSEKEKEIISRTVPILKKPIFTKQDYYTLSKKERLILQNIIRKGSDEKSYSRKNLSIKKDAQCILSISKSMKKSFEELYPNSRLVGIGRSPAPFVETMQMLSADTISIPFSKEYIDYKRCSFPFKNLRTNKEYTSTDWENYLSYYGAGKDFIKKTGKTLVFTDITGSGETINRVLKPILQKLNYPLNTTVEEVGFFMQHLEDKDDILKEFDVSCALDRSELKRYATKLSARDPSINIDIFKTPGLIETMEQPFDSKIFRFAIFDEIQNNK